MIATARQRFGAGPQAIALIGPPPSRPRVTVPSAATIRSRICQSGSRMLHLLYCSQSLFSVEQAVTVNGPSIA